MRTDEIPQEEAEVVSPMSDDATQEMSDVTLEEEEETISSPMEVTGGRPPDVFFQSPIRTQPNVGKTPVARVVGGDGDLELGTTALSPGRSPIAALAATPRAAVISIVEAVTSTFDGTSVHSELSFGAFGFCSLLLILICLLLLARQIAKAV